MSRLTQLLPLLALGVSALAMADEPQLYKWTDAQGTLHFSDQPPTQPVLDFTASAMPAFPPVDTAKLAQDQVNLLAQLAALQQLQAQMAAQAQAAALARQQAQLAAAQAQQAAQEPPASPEPIYISSAFVPRIYRANLYVHGGRRLPRPHASMPPPLPTKSPGSLRIKP